MNLAGIRGQDTTYKYYQRANAMSYTLIQSKGVALQHVLINK